MKTKIITVIVFALVFIWSSMSYAETYWVDDDGTKTTKTDCDGATPIISTDACTLAAANGFLLAGDTVYLRGGTYTIGNDYAIDPENNGTSGAGNRITYEEHTGETVTFVGNSGWARCIDLTDRSYITIRNITCQDFTQHMYMGSESGCSEYNEIDGCTFSGMFDPPNIDHRGSTITGYGSGGMCGRYNWIHDSTFEEYGYFGDADDEGLLLEIGWDEGTSDTVEYNVIEDSIFKRGGHHVVGLHGYRNVLRNNYLQNEAWGNYQGTLYGSKVLYSLDWVPEGYHLVEGNRLAFGSTSPEVNSEGEGHMLSSKGNIIRYNVYDNNNEAGVYQNDHHANSDADLNHFYNNTFWYNGHDRCYTCSPIYYGFSHGIFLADSGVVNYFKNNLFYDNLDEINDCTGDGVPYPLCEEDMTSTPCGIASGNATCYPSPSVYANNYEGIVSGNPNFVNIDGTPDPDKPTQFDFNLQSTSNARDGGTYLTEVNESNCTDCDNTVVVDDALYFQPGWGNGAGGGAVVEADWIAIGTVGNGYQISSINYGTNTLTLDCTSGVNCGNRNDNDDVWLYKNSSGEIVLVGSAPDQGAYEYDISPPENLRLIE